MKLITRLIFGFALLAIGLIMIPATQARAINRITVIVRDSTGNLVEDAKVIVTNIEGGYDRLWRTNGSGAWTFANAPAGNYVINARFLKGRFEVGEVEVYVDGDVTVDVSMSTPEEMVIIDDFSRDTRIVVSELTIKPAVVEFKETVEISVVLNNIGENYGIYDITLRVYGPFLYDMAPNVFGMSMQGMRGGDFRVDSRGFNPYQLICAEGTYTVSYGGLTGSFEVVSKHDGTHVASENLLPKYILVLMILITGIAGSLLFFYRRVQAPAIG